MNSETTNGLGAVNLSMENGDAVLVVTPTDGGRPYRTVMGYRALALLSRQVGQTLAARGQLDREGLTGPAEGNT